MFKSEPYLTVAVYSLTAGVREAELQAFFNKHIPSPPCSPRVGSITPRWDGTWTATVTLRGDSETLRREIDRLRRPSADKSPFNPTAGFDYTFIGLTPLYQSSEQPPLFDVYFVHGLGGHAFNTWASKPSDHVDICMWPRDVLGPYLERQPYGPEKLYGRYWTFGYDARIDGRRDVEQSIPQAAQTLINAIATSRSRTTTLDTPIFFVCHSLGGLVTCQAVVEVLTNEKYRENIDQFLRDAFFHQRHHKCLVRGIATFGTPFGGSKLANLAPYAAPVLGIRAGQGSFISALKVNDPQVQAIVQAFDDARRARHNRIRLVIFYETKMMGKYFLRTMITEKRSAQSTFWDKVEEQALPLDHRDIVKFSHAADRIFDQTIGPMLTRMIQRGLEEMDYFETQHGPTLALRTGRATGTYQQVEMLDLVADLSTVANFDETAPNPNLHIRSPLQKHAKFAEVDAILRIIQEGITRTDNSTFIERQRSLISKPIGDTCDWLLSEQRYQAWESSNSDNILFVTGDAGTGKSVLAEFIVQRLLDERKDAVVACFFCKSLGTVASPSSILRHIILQLHKQCPELLLRTLLDRPIQSFAGHFDADILWTIFRAMCEKLTQKVYVIIDGLDECLGKLQFRPKDIATDADPTRRFLGQICSLMRGSAQGASMSTSSGAQKGTSICFLTRPQDQIEAVAAGRDFFIRINAQGVQNRAVQVIGAEIDRLVDEQQLPANLAATVKQDLQEKARQTPNSAFQWANTAIERFQDDDRPANERLASIRPGLYAVYTDILTDLSSDPDVKHLASFTFRLLVFQERALKLTEVQHAYAMDAFSRMPNDLPAIEKLTTTTIQIARGLLALEDDFLVIAHESVRDFLRQLSNEEWPAFGCSNTSVCQSNIAILCLSYMRNSFQRVMSTQDIESEIAAIDDAGQFWKEPQQTVKVLWARFRITQRISVFFGYALSHWESHTRQCRVPGQDLLQLLRDFFRMQNNLYQCWSIYQTLDEDGESSGVVEDPVFSIVRSNFVEILGMIPLKVSRSSILKRPSLMRGMLKSRIASRTQLDKKPKHGYLALELDVHAKNESEETVLHIASEKGYLELAEYLLGHGAEGNVLSHFGVTPFYLALVNGHEKVAEILIHTQQASLCKAKDVPISELHWACHFKMDSVVEFLIPLTEEIDLKCSDLQESALHMAARRGCADIVKRLLDGGANPGLVRTDGNTAFHLAALAGNVETCRLLLEKSRGTLLHAQNREGRTALFTAAAAGQIETVVYLVAQGADTRPEYEFGLSPVHAAFLSRKLDIFRAVATEVNAGLKDKLHRQPIHLAAQLGEYEMVERLIELHADTSAMCMDWNDEPLFRLNIPPIFLAIEGGHTRVFDLLSTQAQATNITEFRTLRGETLLSPAVRSGNAKIVQQLVEGFDLDPYHHSNNGKTVFHLRKMTVNTAQTLLSLAKSPKDIDMRDSDGYTPLLSAAQVGKKDLVGFYLSIGADPLAVDSLGRDAVHLLVGSSDAHASNDERTEALQNLLARGVPATHALLRSGDTSMHRAAARNRSDLIDLLIQAGASVNYVNSNGRTPLHTAALSRFEEVFSKLLGLGADPKVKDYLGFTALNYAANYQPILSLTQLTSQSSNGRNLDKQDRTPLIRTAIAKMFVDPRLMHPEYHSRSMEEFRWVFDMAESLLLLDSREDIRICLEHCLQRQAIPGSIYGLPCLKCEDECTKGPFFICMDCRPTFSCVCKSCYAKYKNGNCIRGCSKEHSQLEIGGEYFERLKYGTVREDGLTIQEWYDNLRKEFAAEIAVLTSEAREDGGGVEEQSAGGATEDAGVIGTERVGTA